MGTEYAVTWSGGAHCTPELAPLIEAELHSVNAQMSTYLPESELSQFNSGVAGQWIEVSAELANIVAVALDLSRSSDGAFDITVGPLVNLWGFGAVKRDGLPSAVEIEQAAARVGYEMLEFRLSPPGLRKWIPDLYVDLSAIAKGHGVDRLAGLLDNRGCSDYLVEIGGEVRVRGLNPSGASWRVAIQTPDTGGAPVGQYILALPDKAVATSGDYRNFRMVANTRLNHTIDPRTGWPVAHELASITVVAETAALADGLATLINVLGADEGLMFAEHRGVAALALVRSEGGYEQRYTDAMRNYAEDLP